MISLLVSKIRSEALLRTTLTGFDCLDPLLQSLVGLDQGRRGTRSHLTVVHERCTTYLLNHHIIHLRTYCMQDAHDLGSIVPRNHRPSNVSLNIRNVVSVRCQRWLHLQTFT
jgi:hypothetical protein